jgi:hypothetical protein
VTTAFDIGGYKRREKMYIYGKILIICDSDIDSPACARCSELFLTRGEVIAKKNYFSENNVELLITAGLSDWLPSDL